MRPVTGCCGKSNKMGRVHKRDGSEASEGFRRAQRKTRPRGCGEERSLGNGRKGTGRPAEEVRRQGTHACETRLADQNHVTAWRTKGAGAFTWDAVKAQLGEPDLLRWTRYYLLRSRPF